MPEKGDSMVDDYGQAVTYQDAKFSWLAPFGLLLIPLSTAMSFGTISLVLLIIFVGFGNAWEFIWTFVAMSILLLLPAVPLYLVGYGIRRLLRVQRWFPGLGTLLSKLCGLLVFAFLLNKMGSWFGWDWATAITGYPAYFGSEVIWLLSFIAGLFGAYSERELVPLR